MHRPRRVAQSHHDLLGTHVSVAGGVELAPHRGRLLGCSAIQVFTKSGRAWHSPAIPEAQARRFRDAVRAAGLDAVIAHSSYLINLGAPDRALREKSVRALIDEIERCALLGVASLITHPGSHLGAGERHGLRAVAASLRAALRATRGLPVRLLLENVAGQGTNLGHRLEHLAAIRADASEPDRVGFCLDTCHAFAAGQDLRTRAGFERMMAEWDCVLGVNSLGAVHLNDSKRELGSRVDRHEHIGKGQIGLGGFHALLHDPRLARLPKVLETPKRADACEDRANLRVLRRLLSAEQPPAGRPRWHVPPQIDRAWVERLARPI